MCIRDSFNEESLALANAVGGGLFNLHFQKSKLFLKTCSRVLKIITTLLETEMTIVKIACMRMILQKQNHTAPKKLDRNPLQSAVNLNLCKCL